MADTFTTNLNLTKPEVHSKCKTSNSKNSVNYKKKYKGQVRS